MILKLQLFNNTYTDNHNRIGKFADLNAQETYFNNLPKIEIDGNFNKIGENITITGDYSVLIGYNYGRFKYHNIWYYFSVIDYNVVNETKIEIIYSIDCYETARYQYNISIGKGTINNITHNVGLVNKIPKSFNGLGKKKLTTVEKYHIYGLLLYVHSSTENKNKIYYVKDTYSNNNDAFMTLILKGTLLDTICDKIGIQIDDIRGCWALPSIMGNIFYATHGWYETETNSNIWYFDLYNISGLKTTKNINIKRSDTEYTVFRDCKGNIVWECPKGNYYDDNLDLTLLIDISANSCVIKIFVDNKNSDEDIIVLPLETIEVFNDAFKEYSYRQRFADIENRQISREMETWKSGLNIGGQIVQGGVAGVGGGLIGSLVGATVGAISGTVSTVGGHFVNEYYGNKQQDVIDHQYRNEYDNLLLQGSGISGLFENLTDCGFYKISYETDLGTPRTEKTIETYGYDINQHYPNVQEYINGLMTVNGNPYVRGNFEINGHIPDSWKQKIKERFNGGVTFG